MLIEFSVGNYRSFKEKVTFSMLAANLVAKDKQLDDNNVFAVDDNLQLLKSAAIYGANASGKSNVAKALNFMKWFMINSSKETQSTEEINVERFRLSTETETEPSFFELVFLLDGQRYRYGFEATPSKVVSEWLYYVPKLKETKLFERENNKISSSKTYKADGIQEKTRHNALFLAVSAQFNVKIAEKILRWLTNNLRILFGDDITLDYTLDCLRSSENKVEIIQLIRKLDLGINGLEIGDSEILDDASQNEISGESNTRSFSLKKILNILKDKKKSISTIHKKLDYDGNEISTEIFDLREQESAGTQKLFALAGSIVDALKGGKVLIVDELDARLHPLISLAIVELFNSNETNPNNAQLVFMTHDTNLLSNKVFRRDQIWFAEKNKQGATDLYSLAEYKVRNDASFDSDYIKGRYGAIPYIGKLNHLVDSHV